MIWKKLKHRGEGEVEPDLASLFFPRASWRGNGGGGWACCWMPALLPCLSPVPSCSSYLHGVHTSVAAHFLSGNWNLFHYFTISLSMFISPALLRVCLESLNHTETISCWRIRPGLENSAKFYAGQSFEKIAFQRLAGSAYDKLPRKGNIWLVSICESIFKHLAQRLWVSVYKVESMAIPKGKRIFRKKQFCANSVLLHPLF